MELKKQCSPLSVYLFRKRLILTLAVLLIYLGLVNGRPLHAQTQTPDSYWEYVAAGRLTHVVPADVNQDGVLELIVAADNGKVDLLNAHDARIEWSYTADDVVQALGAVNIDEATHLPLEIALVANDQLILLDQSGEEIWRAQILAVDPPPAGLVGSSEETLAEWYAQFDLEARQILPFDADGNGRDEILILFDTGQLQLFDSAGNLLQRRTANTTPNIDTQPHIAVGDLNGDGRLEIVLGMFNEQKRFSELYLLDSNGNELWSDIPAISGHITDLVLVPFGPDGQLQIGVSTDRGQLHLFNHDRQRQWWPRTLNKPIMALTVGQFPEGPALIAGTDVGMVVAYSAEGRRFWSRRLTTDADRAVIGLSAADFSPEQREPAVAVVLGPQDEENDGRTVKLLDVSGLEVGEFAAGEDSSALPLLLDVNGDRHNELMLTRFATISLQGLGIGASETAREWNYLLEANPGAVLVVDFNNDGKDELLIGAQNGRLHYLDDRNDPEWIAKPGGAITHLALLARNSYPEPIPSIAVVRNSEDKEDSRNPQSWLELRHTNGERVWEQPLSAPISALLVERINETGDPNIIVGTEIGEIIVFSSSGTVQWRESVSEGRPIRQLLLVNAPNGVPRLVAVTANNMYSTTLDDNLAPRIATYEKKINQL
ncbi:MAG: VCBS repeat-containing protein, partial [Chloroflexi bacterium]|nr:VCBS repeat-containing protein [Chloroflexota bacterium]